MKAETQSRADRAGGVTGEIEKYLAGERYDAEPRIKRDKRTAVTKDAIGRTGKHRVGQHDFLEEAQCHKQQTPKEPTGLRPGRSRQLGKKITGAHDRSGDELRKKRNSQNEVTQRFCRLQYAAINVQCVGEGMERVK